MLKHLNFTLLAALLCASAATEAEVRVILAPTGDDFTLVSAKDKATIVYDAADAQVVATAAEALRSDIALVTGQTPDMVSALGSTSRPIIIGTVGKSALINNLVSRGKLDVSDVEGKWESYGLQTVENPAEGIARALVIYGSTPRGTAYGVFELSKMLGVSPYVWWADVVPEHHDIVGVTAGKTVVGEPSVKYRGIFINDEDWGLFPWASTKMDPDRKNVGPHTYAKVMELLLRLRANTLWPAMHPCSEAFWANKANLPVAKKYDIVLGSSHCEQMLRNNVWEWDRFGGKGNTNWNYATNASMVQNYWAARVGESRGYDAMYTLGMRGVHDTGINGYPTTADKVKGLTDIIAYQRQLIADSLGEPSTVPQLFIPYKEVLDAYNAGLKVPDDVTLMWVDDNHGYVRQLPTAAEQARKGGNGIYYHLSYWGTPESYLWLSSISPSLCSYELTKCYDAGIRQLWIINVGDIKPAEEETEFCMDLAWDVSSWKPQEAYKYSRTWAARTFGETVADEIGSIKQAYYRLAAGGKPEHITRVNYTREEKDARVAAYQELIRRVDAVKPLIADRLNDAFFQLVEYPVKCAAEMNVKIFRAAESFDYAGAGLRDTALAYAAESGKAYNDIVALTAKYNTGIAGGKWNGMMTCKPQGLQQFNMPSVAAETDISASSVPMDASDHSDIYPSDAYTASKGNIVVMRGLGVSGTSVTVWPMEMKSASVENAPYAEYDVKVSPGANTIVARFLPTFPVNGSYDLRAALSVDGGTPTVSSLKTVAMSGIWNTTVLQGFNAAKVSYAATTAKTIKVRVYMLDPSVVLSDIVVTTPADESGTLSARFISNYDFEYAPDGTLNASGATCRGIPLGWRSVGNLKLNASGNKSYGINNDGSNIHGGNLCWINSTPMPASFELYQTLPAGTLEPGNYRVTCRLWVENGKEATCRLFANGNVQYFSTADKYAKVLTEGERNTYAGYSNVSSYQLKNMSVDVTIGQGDSLRLGIKSSNRKSDGTAATDNSGWFKVDYFRLQHVENPADAVVAPTSASVRSAGSGVYDIGGRRVARSLNGSALRRGVYIFNGKKQVM
jgi:hypothetical protein